MIITTQRKEERECLYSSLILKMFKNPETRGYDHLNTPNNNDGSKQGMQAVMIINTKGKEGSKQGRERKGKEGRKRMLVLSHLAMIHVLLGGVFFAKFPK